MQLVNRDEAPARPATATTAATKGKKVTGKQIQYPFWLGGSASGMAACVTHPLDLVKVRLQMRTADMPKSMSGTFVHVVQQDGVRGLYSGLSASLLRQLTYSTVRFGLYEDLKERATTRDPLSGSTIRAPSPATLVALAAAAGFVGGISGNAADVLNVRMQHDAALPAQRRRHYPHALRGMLRMASEEGLGSWFRGVWPNSLRAAAMTASQVASYDILKRALQRLTRLDDGLAMHFSASFLAGIVAATVTSPIDVIKTRVMSGTERVGLPRVLRDLYAAEGLRFMFKGWVPSFLRLGPQTICTFLFLETHRKIYRRLTASDKGIDGHFQTRT